MRWLLIMGLLWAVTASAADPPIRLDRLPGCTIAWDFEPNTDLGYFALYKRPPDQSFSNSPVKVIPAMEVLVLGIPCDSVRWGADGLYYVALRAFPARTDLQPSGFSNEVLVQIGDAVDPLPPTTPAPSPPKPPKTFLPEKPPPLTTGPKTPPPPPSGQGTWFTETCGYTGRCPPP